MRARFGPPKARQAAVAVALLVLITPGPVELLEDAVHYAVHGDTFHDEGHDDAEHCCSGAFHVCSCHARTHAAPAPTVFVPARPPATPARAHAPAMVCGGPAEAHALELVRPPTA